MTAASGGNGSDMTGGRTARTVEGVERPAVEVREQRSGAAPCSAGARPAPARPASSGDALVRRILRVPEEGRASAAGAQNVFSVSMAVSAVRCLLTYVVLPLLAPVLNLTGGVGPVLGLVVGTVSMVAIVVSMRRFWAADHRWRWRYGVIGGAVLVLLAAGAVDDVATLVG